MFSIYKQSDAQTLTLDSCLTWRSPVKRKGVLKGKWSLLYFISLEENRKGAHYRMCGKKENMRTCRPQCCRNKCNPSVSSIHNRISMHVFKKKRGGGVQCARYHICINETQDLYQGNRDLLSFIHHVLILMLLLFKDILIVMEIMTYGNKPNMHTIVLLCLRS